MTLNVHYLDKDLIHKSFSSCLRYLASRTLETIKDHSYNIGGVYNLELDYQYLVDEFIVPYEQQVDLPLKSQVEELKQFLRLFLHSADQREILDNQIFKKYYHTLSSRKLVRLLEKYKEEKVKSSVELPKVKKSVIKGLVKKLKEQQ